MTKASSARLAAIAMAVYALSAGVRLLEWPRWLDAPVLLDGLPVLPTADAYAWLAGAEGTGRLADWPMAVLIAGLTGIFQQAPEWVAFWLPVVLGPLPSVLIALLCMRRGYPLAALAAGARALVAASCEGSFGRHHGWRLGAAIAAAQRGGEHPGNRRYGNWCFHPAGRNALDISAAGAGWICLGSSPLAALSDVSAAACAGAGRLFPGPPLCDVRRARS
jgi:hypothetical protein